MTPCYHTAASSTAAPMFGHRCYIGAPTFVAGPVTPGLCDAVLAERLRRDLEALRMATYAGCDRAPFGWEYAQ